MARKTALKTAIHKYYKSRKQNIPQKIKPNIKNYH
jgi:hypothetical protein